MRPSWIHGLFDFHEAMAYKTSMKSSFIRQPWSHRLYDLHDVMAYKSFEWSWLMRLSSNHHPWYFYEVETSVKLTSVNRFIAYQISILPNDRRKTLGNIEKQVFLPELSQIMHQMVFFFLYVMILWASSSCLIGFQCSIRVDPFWEHTLPTPRKTERVWTTYIRFGSHELTANWDNGNHSNECSLKLCVWYNFK